MTTPNVTPTPTAASASADAPASGSAGSSSGSPVFTLAIELLGVVILSVIAGIGPRTGKIVTLFMLGLVVLWLILNAATLAKLIPGNNVSTQG